LSSPILSAQKKDLLLVSAKLDSQRATIREIINHIQVLEEVQLSYSEENINNLDTEIEIPEGSFTVQSLLELVAKKSGLTYKLVGKNIILKPEKRMQADGYTVSGHVYDQITGETMIGTTIQIKGTYDGTVTNVYGYYSLKVPTGDQTLIFSSVGYGLIEKEISLTGNMRLDIHVKPFSQLLNEVVVSGEKPEDRILDNKMGHSTLTSETIREIPALMGEVDVLRTLKLLPGVQMTSETSSGFSVRGGSYDQNLILLDEAVVYNPSHMLGFFSTFNNDAVKSMEFYKGNMPARFGGRLSSLLDIRMKEGNNKKITGRGGISPIASRLTLEMPIVKEKGSLMVSGRRTYADVIAKLSGQSFAKNTTLFFHDFNLKANYKLSDNDRIYLSSYLGRDVLALKSGNGVSPDFRWGNVTSTFRWNHIFSDRLFSNVSLIYSNYDYKLGLGFEDFSFVWESNLKDYSLKIDFDYFLNPKNTVVFGATSTFHYFDPGSVKLQSKNENGTGRIPKNQALDHAIYLGNEQKISDKLSFSYGARLGIFQNIGKGTLYKFDENFERVDSVGFKKGEIYHTYYSLEPRWAGTYVINSRNSIKASYARTTQFLHLASNSISGTPLDIWIPSTPNVKPQLADQVSLGYFKNLLNNQLEVSAEIYYKWMRRQIDFKDHASLLLNEEIEGELRIGEARAYGVELLIKKPRGKLNGWLSVTLSRSRRKIPTVNEGREYNSTFDRPVNISAVANYDISKRVTFSATWTFFNGLPFTAPSGRMHFGNKVVPTYTGRNGDRLPDYHRMDLGLNIENRKKPGKKVHSSWNISVYNTYGRKNPAFVTFRENEDNPGVTEAVQTAIFRWVPTVTWNFNF
ncbi:MAG: TonB-dependent receptor, partial [Cyclobacteriaceae bacterium]|nr:TonB-dependent receptor [Cyclobacteriaceae bacterium HetDA_MAG_MS6]